MQVPDEMNSVLVVVVKNLNIVMENNIPPTHDTKPSLWEKIWSLGTISSPKMSASKEAILFLRDICIILAIVLFVKGYIGSPFRISGSSMETSYHNGEFIIVDRISYGDFPFWKVGNPARGDVIVIRPHTDNGKEYYIKRLIGLPGDEIKIENGNVYLKSVGTEVFVELQEGYLSPANKGKTYPGRTSRESTFRVPLGQYFLLGDNRNGSADSRDCFYSCNTGATSHYIDRKDIVGRLYLSLGVINLLDKAIIWPTIDIQLAKDIGFSTPPRWLDTPSTWSYPELEKTSSPQ